MNLLTIIRWLPERFKRNPIIIVDLTTGEHFEWPRLLGRKRLEAFLRAHPKVVEIV